MEKYVVYTQIHENGTIQNWYYGTYNSKDRANEVAKELGGKWPVYHCVCTKSEAMKGGIENLPLDWK